MVDANVPDIALEPDKTVKKVDIVSSIVEVFTGWSKKSRAAEIND